MPNGLCLVIIWANWWNNTIFYDMSPERLPSQLFKNIFKTEILNNWTFIIYGRISSNMDTVPPLNRSKLILAFFSIPFLKMLLSIFYEKYSEKAQLSQKMQETDGSTLYLMDGLTLLRHTKTSSYFQIFHIVN